MANLVRNALIVGALLASAGCGKELAVTNPRGDYAAARQAFQTKLVRRGPAPQEWEPLQAPPGATEVTFDSGGRALKAFVSSDPGDGRRLPAVLFLHGGYAFGDGDWESHELYRNLGYVVMTPVLRGENGQAGEFTMFYDEVDDVLAAADALARLPWVNPDRLFVVGHSAGGTLATLAAMTSDRFVAAASFSGSMDQKANADANPELAVFDRTDPREVEMRSPVAFAASFRCPTRLYYGSKEFWAYRPTKRTAELAREKGLNVQAVQVPGDHFSSVPTAIQNSIDFFGQVEALRAPVGSSDPEDRAPAGP